MKFVTALHVLLLLGLAGCSSERPSADEKRQIDAGSRSALQQLYRDVRGSQDLANRAQGILVFPDVYKVAIGIGGEYGKGALLVGGRTVNYYSIGAGSLGLQLGAEARDVVFMFMTPQALADFRNSSGWEASATAGVAVVKKGAEDTVTTGQANAPVIVFVFGNTGLMADASVAGTKISKLEQ